MKKIFVLLMMGAVFSCTNEKPKSNYSVNSSNTIEERDSLKKAKDSLWLIEEIRKRAERDDFYKNIQVSKEKKETTPQNFGPNDAYVLGFDEGFDAGYEDAINLDDYELNYDDSNNFYGIYHTKYCNGYRDGYEEGYEEGAQE